MKHLTTVIVIAWAYMSSQVLADQPNYHPAWVAASAGGRYLFKMVPPAWPKSGDATIRDKESIGIAYELTETGEFKEIWRTKEGYAYKGFVSRDGRYLVGLGPPLGEDTGTHSDLAICFYDKGMLLKRYQVRDLLKTPESLIFTASHYQWHPRIQSKPNGLDEPYGRTTFHLVMIDKTVYEFDCKSGDIISTGKDRSAKSDIEIWAEVDAADAKKGSELFDASPLKKPFTDVFEVSNVRSQGVDGSIYGCSFQGEGWTADLTPREKLAHEAMVEVIFGVVDGKQIKVNIPPSDFINALKVTLAHPFVVKQFEEKRATGVRLRVLGDRLHWDTTELAGLLLKLTGKVLQDDELSHWTEFIVDTKGNCSRSGFLDTKTQEVIYEDDSTSPWTPILLDEKGHRAGTRKVSVEGR